MSRLMSNAMYQEIGQSIHAMDKAATELDQMVESNKKYGWSTNNDKAMTDLANDLRRRASLLRKEREIEESRN